MAGRVPPPRPHLPSEVPVQAFDDLPDLRSEDSVLAQLGLDHGGVAPAPPPNLFDPALPGMHDAPPSSGAPPSSAGPPSSAVPSSRLPAGVVFPEAAPAPEPPSSPLASPHDMTQPARRLASVQPPPLSITATAPSATAPGVSDAEVPPTLAQALSRRVRLGTSTVPMWLPAVIGACAVALVFGILAAIGIAVGTRSASGASDASAAASGTTPSPGSPGSPASPATAPATDPETASAAAAAAPPAPRTLVDKAARGDAQAIAELSQKAPASRTIEESIAIASGQARQRQAELAGLGQSANKDDFLNDAENVKRLLGFVQSEDTSRQALEIIAKLPGPAGPDLLYEIWTGTRKKTPTTELAEALVLTRQVRDKASPALAVALDLRSAETCEQSAKVLERAKEHGDRRSLYLVGKLLRKTGCGDNKRSDCYPCLRGSDAIKDALKEVRKRAPPRY